MMPYLQLSEVTGGLSYAIDAGSGFGAAVDLTGATYPLQILTGLPNPAMDQTYSIRVFEDAAGLSTCFTDVVVTLRVQDCTIGCECVDYVYLNDTEGMVVHKFTVEDNGDLTEINDDGGFWYPGANTMLDLASPHGLGVDLNGFLYIAETQSGNIRKLTCDGELLDATEFEVENIGGFNIASIDNLIFANDQDNTDRDRLEVINTCTGDVVNSICFDNQQYNWGLYIDPRTDTIYATSAFGNKAIYKATVADTTSGVCVTPFLTTGSSTVPDIGDDFLPGNNNRNINGLTTDEAGNIYVVLGRPFSTDSPTELYKYSSSGILLAKSIIDDDLGDGTTARFSFAVGIVYSEESGLLYVSNNTENFAEDCISIFDTDPDT